MSAPPRIARRALLAGTSAYLATGASLATTASHDLIELTLDREPRLPRRCSLLLPRAAAAERSLPLLVLLHGLGETKDERAGIRAWPRAYGLSRAWERLSSPPVVRDREPFWSAAELEAVNASLAARPFAGLVLACPYMPNPYDSGGASAIARYSTWLERSLLPAIAERVPSASREPRATGLAGVSLGGYVALEVYLQKSERFATVGTVQGAFSETRARDYAARLAKLAPSGVFVASSSGDPYLRANRRLYRELSSGVPSRLSVRRGPHSQGWLREIGSLEMLLWHDRALRGAVETGEVRAP